MKGYRWIFSMTIGLGMLVLAALPARAQIQAGAGEEVPETVKVFLDCKIRGCDFDYVRTEVKFVDWVRDRWDADVYVLLTSQSAGGGGQAYTFDFLGQGRFEGVDDTLMYVSGRDDTEDEVRTELVRVLKLGLVPYALRTQAGEKLSVGVKGERTTRPQRTLEEDPWDYWVFSTRLNGTLSGEESRSQSETSGSFSARRVTDAWKTSLWLNGNYSETRVELSDGADRKYHTHRLNGNLTVVKSLDGHYAAGIRASTSSSTNVNQDYSLRFAPAFEYSFFPYSEFTRRQLVVQYSLGAQYFNYTEETIFGVKEETRYNHELSLGYEMKQPWGSARTTLESSHYFEDINQYRLALSTNWDIRIFRGFSLNLNGSISKIHDQLYIPARDASDDEILLRIRRLQTGYDYRLRIGFSYTFGSIYNTVVNPRLDEIRSFGRRR
ncbi:MAG: hypothetical protein R6W82_01210 [bacterium]